MPPDSEERWFGAALSSFQGLGPKRLHRLREVFGDWRTAWQVGPHQWPRDIFSGAGETMVQCWLQQWWDGVRRDLPQRIQEDCHRYEITLLTEQDSAYPQRLRQLPTGVKPQLLFVRGNTSSLLRPGVTVVGTRRATAYGIQVAEELTVQIAKLGVVVISGLAFGIDYTAHTTCLKVGGTTVAVLAGGPEQPSPRSHANLYRQLLIDGAVVSEYPPGTKPVPGRFPARNRILAALGCAVIVVEAPARSGALITARHAADIGRPVFAVPGSLTAPQSRGCLELLREGASPLLEASDVLLAIGISSLPDDSVQRQVSSFRLTEMEQVVYAFLEAEQVVTIDGIVAGTGLQSREVMAVLTSLELKQLCLVQGATVNFVSHRRTGNQD